MLDFVTITRYNNNMQDTDKLYVTDTMFKQYLLDITRQMALSNWKPDVIVGPSRGGLQMGVMLSHYFEVPFVPLQWQTYTVDPAGSGGQDLDAIDSITEKHSSNILLVDDINDTGTTLLGITNAMDKPDYFADIKTATLINKTTSSFEDVDYYAVEITPDTDKWVVFPFEEWWK